jgi:hypothetical protein
LDTELAAKEPDPPLDQSGDGAGSVLSIVTLHPMIVTHPPLFPNAHSAHLRLK